MNQKSLRCPKCDGSNFKRWELPHPIMLHWILNPGLIINEIILGQRLPKTQLICEDCEGPMVDRAYIPCPSCKTLHLGRLTSGKNAFGSWRGFSCPTCESAIPCIWNVFSLLVLAVAFPVWALPYFLHFKKQPLKPLYKFNEGNLPTLKPLTRKTWILMGVFWGASMWIFMNLFLTLSRGSELSWSSVIIGLPVWSIGGVAFGFSMWFFLGRKSPKI